MAKCNQEGRPGCSDCAYYKMHFDRWTDPFWVCVLKDRQTFERCPQYRKKETYRKELTNEQKSGDVCTRLGTMRVLVQDS